MMLLDLPPELLVLILTKLDPDSFYIALLVCKTIRDHARSSKVLLKHQLDQLPGHRYHDTMRTETLVQLFKICAHEHLSDGTGILTDVTCFKPGSTGSEPQRIQLRQSSIFRCCGKHITAALVHRDSGSVWLYDLTASRPRLKHTLTLDCLDLINDVHCEALKVAFQNREDLNGCPDTVVVLYSWRVMDELSHPFVEAAAARAKSVLKLVTYDISDSESKITHVQDVLREVDQDPVGLAVAPCGTTVIAWQGLHGFARYCQLVSYSPDQHRWYGSADGFRLRKILKSVQLIGRYPTGQVLPDLPVADIKIVGGRLDLFLEGSPIGTWHVPKYDLQDCAIITDGEFRASDLENRDGISQSFHCGSVGLPLAHHHVHHIKTHLTNETYCLNTVSQLPSVCVVQYCLLLRTRGCRELLICTLRITS